MNYFLAKFYMLCYLSPTLFLIVPQTKTKEMKFSDKKIRKLIQF